MTVLVNAGPWLAVPPLGYGGIENIVATLVPELRRRGVRVVLATVGASTLPVDEKLAVFEDPQFNRLQRPYNEVVGVAAAHMQLVLGELRRRHDIDLVHDHLEAFGPTMLTALGTQGPPVLHTLHWDLRKHPELYGHFDGAGTVFVNGVSAAQLRTAPLALRRHSIGHVHLATPLAVGADRRPPLRKGNHLVVLGRITAYKGQAAAARLAHRLQRNLVLAGPVGPYQSPQALAAADPDADTNPDVRYWREELTQYVDGDRVRWVGAVDAAARDELVGSAAASLFPISWDEPGGTGVVESLALGTPVVGYRRGCLPELVDHGRTGMLTDPGDEDQLAAAVDAAQATIDPLECQRDAASRFTPSRMCREYLELYRTVLATAGRGAAPTTGATVGEKAQAEADMAASGR